MASSPRICAAITGNDHAAVKTVEPLTDLWEVRLDLIGDGWPDLIKYLKKPWIACNRRAEEGGSWQGSESQRINELLRAVELGASIIDIELAAPGVETLINKVKGKAECLLSHHDLKATPSLKKMQVIVRRQLASGADICKVVTTARSFTDNITALQLIADFPETKIVAFAMGAEGTVSRVLCPLAGGYFTYASLASGKESAPGQITVSELRRIYGMMKL